MHYVSSDLEYVKCLSKRKNNVNLSIAWIIFDVPYFIFDPCNCINEAYVLDSMFIYSRLSLSSRNWM